MTTTPTIFSMGSTNFSGFIVSPIDIVATLDGGFRIEVLARKEDSGINVVDQYNLVDASSTTVQKGGDSLTREDDAADIQIIQQANGSFDASYKFGYSDVDGTAQFHPEDRSFVSIDLSARNADCTAMFESRALVHGGFISLWEQTDGQGDDQRTSVWFREVGTDDKPIGDPVAVVADPANNQTAGVMDILSSGDIVIGWDNAAPDAGMAELTVRRYDELGQPLSDATIVATHETGAPTAVHALNGGGYVVAWDNASGHETMFQLFTEDGTAQGGPTSVSGDFSGQITSVFDGGFIIEGSDGGDSFLQRYSSDGVAIGDRLALGGELATLADGRIAVVNLSGYTIIDPRDYEISGTSGDDVIYGRIDGSEISGLEGNDKLFGAALADILRGGAGDDILSGGHAGDVLRGSDGNDMLSGDNGNDDLDGGPGDDGLLGGSGNDVLSGGGGTDTVSGGGGNDIVDGGDGADMLSGGKGKDLFVFDRITDSGGGGTGQHDVISDFSSKGDRIDLHLIDGDSTRGGQQGFTFVGTTAFSGAGQVRYVSQGDTTLVQVNTDADLRADMVIILDGRIRPTAANFILAEERIAAHLDLFQSGPAALHSLEAVHHALV